MTWIPDTCTLPTTERPLRSREFASLFDDALRSLARTGPGALTLYLVPFPRTEERVRDLVARESSCCSFFTFAVERDHDRVKVGVTVPEGREEVLDGLARQAEDALRSRAG
ncbi:hypothetical protein [Nocardiopsis sp. ATB16-24]|uniref:hypothetical protein n=1 Tax=Nocardiopsis sp. ATB16-24 TaxID=3019555 RepID=UPI0025529D1E|nr:hypothetical protein [Nocardiopsis sp. ATB16-24]